MWNTILTPFENVMFCEAVVLVKPVCTSMFQLSFWQSPKSTVHLEKMLYRDCKLQYIQVLNDELDDTSSVSWYKGFQAMVTIALICLFTSLVLVTLYMCVHRISKNSTIIALVIMGFASCK